MKPACFSLFLASAALSLGLSGCGNSHAETHAHTHAAEPAAAAIYKAGHGLKLSPAAAQFLDFAVAEAAARDVADAKAVVAIPHEALLRTVKGDFVYVANGEWFLRTPIATGAQDSTHAAIKEGLYEGDRIVVRGVRGLWLAELQAINGGVGCADHH